MANEYSTKSIKKDVIDAKYIKELVRKEKERKARKGK